MKYGTKCLPTKFVCTKYSLEIDHQLYLQSMPHMKTQMQLSWLHMKMLDQSVKTQENVYRCNGSVPYDTCMYSALTKVCICNNNQFVHELLDQAMTSNTRTSCTVPWVPDDKSICTTKEDMNTSYWTHYKRITNQQVTYENY